MYSKWEISPWGFTKNFVKLPLPYARFQKKIIWLDRTDDDIMERIKKRSQEMIYNGMIEETEEAARAGIRNHPTLSGAVGYREVLDFLGGGGNKEDLTCIRSQNRPENLFPSKESGF